MTGDSLPLHFRKVTARLPHYQLLFFADARSAPLRLTAIRNGEEPVYDIDGHLALANGKLSPRIVSLGAFSEEPLPASSLENISRKANHRWLLQLAVVLVIIIMGIALARVSRQGDSRE